MRGTIDTATNEVRRRALLLPTKCIKHEKQLEKVLLNTNHFIGSIKGIAGSSMPDLKQIGESDNILELEE